MQSAIGTPPERKQRWSPQRWPIRIAGLFREGLRELWLPGERRVPFLDGLRSIAILLVINSHVGNIFAKVYGPNAYTRSFLCQDGWVGVDLFFVLSGYFIGSQLWRELGATGTISIGNFMIRRGLRIWPLYYFIFVMMTITAPALAAAKQHGWSDLVFLTNYLPYGIVLGSWSLSSEEQFYLLAPLLLFLVGNRSLRQYRVVLIAALVLEVVVRGATYWHLTGHIFTRNSAAFSALYYPFHTHCDGLIAGLLLANIAADKSFRVPPKLKPWMVVAAGTVTMIALHVIEPEILDFAALGIFFSSFVWLGIRQGPRLFDSYLFYLLSRLSFGMYLIHEAIATTVVGRLIPSLGLLHLGAAGATIAGTVLLAFSSMLLAAITFCLIEHPFLVLRTAVLRRRVVSGLVAH